MTRLALRRVRPADLPALTDIWYDGWHEAHAAIVPPALTAQRTHESFAIRLERRLSQTTAVTLDGGPAGFVQCEGDELYQLYTAPAARGTGAAALLVEAAKDQFAACGIARPYLLCAVGNHRAARFYEKVGWQNRGETVDSVETLHGTFPLAVWRFEITLP